MKTVFLGDSLTAGFTMLDGLEGCLNYGVGGDKTIDLIGRILPVIEERPDQLFLLIGTNDYLVSKGYWQTKLYIDFPVLLDALLTLLRDNINGRIYLVSIPPVRVSKPFDTKQANSDIDQLNKHIAAYVEKYNLGYIDLNTALKNDENQIDERYTTDGVHFTSLGYQVYFDLVKKYLSI